MTRWGRFFMCLGVFALWLGGPSTGLAQGGSLSLFIDQVDITAFPEVTVQLSAWDESGLPLINLKPEDFTLQERDGVPFHPGQVGFDTKAPLQVALALDISGSMAGQPLVDAKVAAARFLDKLTSGDQAALIAFSDPLNLDSSAYAPGREIGLTGNLASIYDLVEKLQAGGNTQLYNAVSKAVQQLSGAPGGHRSVLLISDGKNEPPAVGDPEQPIRLAKEAHIPVFVIGLGDQIDEPYLRRLAGETGGLFRAAPHSVELAQMLSDMAALLKTRYTLTFHSLVTEGGQGELQMTLKAQGIAASANIPYGPLPALPTETPLPSATSLPTSTLEPSATLIPTLTAVPSSPTAVPTFVQAKEVSQSSPWGWLAALGATVVVFIGLALLRRKPRPRVEVCAKCGYDLTGISGACPNCGDTRRLGKKKK